MNKRRFIVHTSYTPPGMDIGVEEIRAWHTDPKRPGVPFADIGYHFVIRRNGAREVGRPLSRVGAHTKGHNADSIGVCLVGGMRADDKKPDSNYTLAQLLELEALWREMLDMFPRLQASGHRDWSDRECPCFDVKEFLRHVR
jgi:N-acetylmuramoyl-L-alanine amidase